jgi:Ras-related protein Rab-8B
MILDNKCDMNDKRQVLKERGEKLAIGYRIKRIKCKRGIFTFVQDIMTKLYRKTNDSNSSGTVRPIKVNRKWIQEDKFLCCSLL